MSKKIFTLVCLCLLIMPMIFSNPYAESIDDRTAGKQSITGMYSNSLDPFGFSNASLKDESLTASGISLSEPIVFTMGYTGLSNGGTAQVVYNLKGLYDSMTFSAGYYEGAQRNASLTVMGDDIVLSDIGAVSYENVSKSYDISVKGVSKLVVIMQSDGYDKARYAMGNVSFFSSRKIPDESPVKSDENVDSLRYMWQNATSADSFSMGGYEYKGGYSFRMGYTGNNSGNTAKLGFNLEGKYEKLSFDIAKEMRRLNEPYTRSAFLTIQLDGETVKDFDQVELKWNDISKPIELDVKNVTQVLIITQSDGYDEVYWNIGNIHAVGSGSSSELTNPFEDVSESDNYYDAVIWAFYSEPQITNGMDATHFGPKLTVTRGQAVTFLWRSMGCPEPSSSNNPFVDVSSTEYYYKPILWAVENGITKGVDATHFKPMDTLSTQHIVTFLFRTKNPGYDGWDGGAAAWAGQGFDGKPFGVDISVNNTTPCPRANVVLFLFNNR